MQQNLLALAVSALVDLRAGYLAKEIDAGAHGTGLDTLLPILITHLRDRGYDDEGSFGCPEIPVKARGQDAMRADLKALQDAGLTFADCVSVFGESAETSRYVMAAHGSSRLEEGILEVDEQSVVSHGADEGAYVMAWLWVSDEEAGISTNSAALERLVEAVRCELDARPPATDASSRRRHAVLAAAGDWLEDLVVNHTEKLDHIEAPADGQANPIRWVTSDGKAYEFFPSAALENLLNLAHEWLEPDDQGRIREFISAHGAKLDSLLTVVRVAEEGVAHGQE